MVLVAVDYLHLDSLFRITKGQFSDFVNLSVFPSWNSAMAEISLINSWLLWNIGDLGKTGLMQEPFSYLLPFGIMTWLPSNVHIELSLRILNTLRPLSSFFFLCGDGLNFGLWELLQGGSCVSQTWSYWSESFLTSHYSRMSQAYLVYFLLQTWIATFLQGDLLVLVRRKQYSDRPHVELLITV